MSLKQRVPPFFFFCSGSLPVLAQRPQRDTAIRGIKLIEFTTGGLSGVSGVEGAMRTHCLIPGLCLFMELVFNVKLCFYLAVTDLQRPDFNDFVL